MKVVNDSLRGEVTKQWKESDENLREQMLAADIFDLKVDSKYGKITEKKETGGIRLLPLPDYVKREQSPQAIEEKMAERGWTCEVHSLPRSSRVIVTFRHAGQGLVVETHPMLKIDAIRFGAILANETEKLIANGMEEAGEEEIEEVV